MGLFDKQKLSVTTPITEVQADLETALQNDFPSVVGDVQDALGVSHMEILGFVNTEGTTCSIRTSLVRRCECSDYGGTQCPSCIHRAVICDSGQGDGVYPVTVAREASGLVTAVSVFFGLEGDHMSVSRAIESRIMPAMQIWDDLLADTRKQIRQVPYTPRISSSTPEWWRWGTLDVDGHLYVADSTAEIDGLEAVIDISDARPGKWHAYVVVEWTECDTPGVPTMPVPVVLVAVHADSSRRLEALAEAPSISQEVLVGLQRRVLCHVGAEGRQSAWTLNAMFSKLVELSDNFSWLLLDPVQSGSLNAEAEVAEVFEQSTRRVLANSLMERQQFSLASEWFKLIAEGPVETDLIEDFPRQAAVNDAMYSLYIPWERYEDAIRLGERALASGGIFTIEKVNTKSNLAQVYVLNGDGDQGLTYADQVLAHIVRRDFTFDVDDGHGGVYYALIDLGPETTYWRARALKLLGRSNEARSSLEELAVCANVAVAARARVALSALH